MNPPSYDCAEDMANLTYLGDACVLWNSVVRYKNELIYTFSGWVNGKVEVTPISEDDNSQTSGDSSSFPDTLTVTRMAPGETQASSSRKTLPDSVTITRVPAPSHPVFQQFQPVATAPVQQLDCVKLQKHDIERRRAEARENLSSSSARDNKGGKRKFEDRMTLTEAKATDFRD